VQNGVLSFVPMRATLAPLCFFRSQAAIECYRAVSFQLAYFTPTCI
jgi:hypothetical protein